MIDANKIIAIRSDLYEHEIYEKLQPFIDETDMYTEQDWLNHCYFLAYKGRPMPWETNSLKSAA